MINSPQSRPIEGRHVISYSYTLHATSELIHDDSNRGKEVWKNKKSEIKIKFKIVPTRLKRAQESPRNNPSVDRHRRPCVTMLWDLTIISSSSIHDWTSASVHSFTHPSFQSINQSTNQPINHFMHSFIHQPSQFTSRPPETLSPKMQHRITTREEMRCLLRNSRRRRDHKYEVFPMYTNPVASAPNRRSDVDVGAATATATTWDDEREKEITEHDT